VRELTCTDLLRLRHRQWKVCYCRVCSDAIERGGTTNVELQLEDYLNLGCVLVSCATSSPAVACSCSPSLWARKQNQRSSPATYLPHTPSLVPFPHHVLSSNPGLFSIQIYRCSRLLEVTKEITFLAPNEEQESLGNCTTTAVAQALNHQRTKQCGVFHRLLPHWVAYVCL